MEAAATKVADSKPLLYAAAQQLEAMAGLAKKLAASLVSPMMT